MKPDKEKILQWLKSAQVPGGVDCGKLAELVREVCIEGDSVFIHLELNPAFDQAASRRIKTFIDSGIRKAFDVATIEIQISKAGGPHREVPEIKSLKIRHIIAVASGKGGVGKSTVSVNLAAAMQLSGAKVGIMDADIYGPNIPLMLGVDSKQSPEVNDKGEWIPVEAYGLKMISMGILVPKDQPIIWRGPMLHKVISSFFEKVDWGECDVLVVDLPPGTGDVQLSLVQIIPLAGVVIVTTPQEVALADVHKAVAMFRETKVPILGVIENMTGDIFGRGGGEKAAKAYQVPFLGAIPLDAEVCACGDSGRPIVFSSSEIASRFKAAADSVLAELRLHSVG